MRKIIVKRKKPFILIELTAVLVMLVILALIVTQLVMNIMKKAKGAANKRSVDVYGKSLEKSLKDYYDTHNAYPSDYRDSPLDYTGKKVDGDITIEKSMIVNSKYCLEGSSTNSGGAEKYYNWERENEVYSGKSISWIGKIALMYPSDNYYNYALGVDNICYIDGTTNGCQNSLSKTNGCIYNISSTVN